MSSLLTNIWSIIFSAIPSSATSPDGSTSLPARTPEVGVLSPKGLQGSNSKPVLFLQHRAGRDGEIMLAGHRSHSSHSSHASHASHASHYSGSSTPSYPSSTSTYPSYSTPSPAPVPSKPIESPRPTSMDYSSLIDSTSQKVARKLFGTWSSLVGNKTVKMVITSAPGSLFHAAITVDRTTYLGVCDSIGELMMSLKITGTQTGTHGAKWIYHLDSDQFHIQHFGMTIFPGEADTLMFHRSSK